MNPTKRKRDKLSEGSLNVLLGVEIDDLNPCFICSQNITLIMIYFTTQLKSYMLKVFESSIYFDDGILLIRLIIILTDK